MYLLSQQELSKIKSRVALAELQNASLSVDLVDHICCMIEERIDRGSDIKRAEDEVFKEMGEVQLKAIEIETKLLTQKKYTMKKRTKIIGYIAAGLLIAGSLMKISHLMGANIVFGFGVLLAVFGYTLLLTYDRFSYQRSTIAKLNGVIGYLGAASYLLGFGLNFLNYPISNILMGAGGFVLLVYFFVNNRETTASS